VGGNVWEPASGASSLQPTSPTQTNPAQTSAVTVVLPTLMVLTTFPSVFDCVMLVPV
jgi:hypothetical protein